MHLCGRRAAVCPTDLFLFSFLDCIWPQNARTPEFFLQSLTWVINWPRLWAPVFTHWLWLNFVFCYMPCVSPVNIACMCVGYCRSFVNGGNIMQCIMWLKSCVWHYWHYCCCHRGALTLWCYLLFGCRLGNTARKFLADRNENINKISCLIGGQCSKVLQVIEGSFRDTCFSIWNCSLTGECQ